eukprot:scaffold150420_cov23-Tisochrysis_lutea.AAC.1
MDLVTSAARTPPAPATPRPPPALGHPRRPGRAGHNSRHPFPRGPYARVGRYEGGPHGSDGLG